MTAVTKVGRHAATWRDPLARVGIAARGFVYLVLGFLAVQFARGDVAGDQVNQTGAFETLGHSSWGKVLLVLLIGGLAAMTVFSVIQTIWGDPVEGDEPKDRVKFALRAVLYASLTVTAVKVAADAWSSEPNRAANQQSGDATQRKAASTLFDLPAGRLLVVLLGLIVIAVGLYHLWHSAIKAKFMERLDPPRRLRSVVEAAGRFGSGARSVVFVISGVFFLVAAAQYDPAKSKGVSGALQELAQHSWGRVVLWATAVGLFVFGLFCMAEACFRRDG